MIHEARRATHRPVPRRLRASLLAVGLLLSACGDEAVITDPICEHCVLDSWEDVMAALDSTFETSDELLYESLLDDAFWFTETECGGELVLANGKEEEMQIIFGPRDGSAPGLSDHFPSVEWVFTLARQETELATDFPDSIDGDPDGHPDQDWEVVRGRVEILLLETQDSGFRIDQVMTFKMRQDEDGRWRLVRWIADPLAGNCGDDLGKAAEQDSWADIKLWLMRQR